MLLRADQTETPDVATLDSTRYAVALIKAGDEPGYDQFRRDMIKRFASIRYPVEAERIVKNSLLLPPDKTVMAALAPFVDASVKAVPVGTPTPAEEPWPGAIAWRCDSLALWSYRQEDYGAAVGWCQRCLSYGGDPARVAMANAVLAMSYYRLGQMQNATNALALSRTMIDTVIHERASLLVQDALSDPRFGAAQSVIMEQIRSALITPLFDNTQVIGVLYADTRELISPYNKEHLRQLAVLANILAIKITNSRLLEVEQEKRAMEQEIATAARIQRALLVQDLPCPLGYELHARLEPCTAVGGDLYDVLELPEGKYGLVVGDVVGHGVGAALLMANALAAIRALAGELKDPVELVERIHAQIFSTTDSTSYLTLFFGVLDPHTHTLEYVNAAQEAPVLLQPGSPPIRLDSTGPPVGLLPISAFTAARVDIGPRARLCAAKGRGRAWRIPARLESVLPVRRRPKQDERAHVVDHAAAPVLPVGPVGRERIPRAPETGCDAGPRVEHQQVGARALAVEHEPGAVVRPSGWLFRRAWFTLAASGFVMEPPGT